MQKLTKQKWNSFFRITIMATTAVEFFEDLWTKKIFWVEPPQEFNIKNSPFLLLWYIIWEVYLSFKHTANRRWPQACFPLLAFVIRLPWFLLQPLRELSTSYLLNIHSSAQNICVRKHIMLYLAKLGCKKEQSIAIRN